MDRSEALQAITDRDQTDLAERAARLQELVDLLPGGGFGVHGAATRLMFEDVKATWIYGYFVSTIVTSYAFCLQQLAGNVRILSNVSSGQISSELDLEGLAAIAQTHSLITTEQHANLVDLHDRAHMYLDASVDEYHPLVEIHIQEVHQLTDNDALLTDARLGLRTAVSLLFL